MADAAPGCLALCAVALLSGCTSPQTWARSCVATDGGELAFTLSSGWIQSWPALEDGRPHGAQLRLEFRAVAENRRIRFITVAEDPRLRRREGPYSTVARLSGLAPGEYVVEWPDGFSVVVWGAGKERWIEMQGKVSYFPGYAAIGGEGPPGGYCVNGCMLKEANGRPRQFADYSKHLGKYVRVRGRRIVIPYGGVETPGGSLPGVVVERIERVR